MTSPNGAIIGPNPVTGCGRFWVGEGTVIDPSNLFRAHGRAGGRVFPAGDQYDKHPAVAMIIADGPLTDMVSSTSGPTWECTS